MVLERGTLILNKKGKPLINIDGKPFNPAEGEVSQSLLGNLKRWDGKEVEFERVQGQPKKIREVGGDFISPRPDIREAHRDKPQADRGSSSQAGRPKERSEQREQNKSQRERDFHNPYNFVPAPPRNTGDPELGDHCPVEQDTFLADRYTGSIRVRMTARTPLLVPDTEQTKESANGHKTFPLRLDADGKPLVPASSVRGMLRSAYEAVTNSRFGRFSEAHDQKLKYRENRPPFRKVEFNASARDLLHESLHPAAATGQLSPADRVFGWVKVDADTGSRSRGERVAARGLLRISPVRCQSNASDAVASFESPGIPLAILSAPKPQQGRFYVAKSQDGEAQKDGLAKVEAGYSPGKGLRGRKVYPHQRSLPDGHWDHPVEDRTQSAQGMPAHYQEYRRPCKGEQEQRDNQNRSILGWIKPGAQFSFDIQVMNLSQVELGALLWLLTLPDDHFFRFGGGKPLGFGSVRLEIESCDLRTGNALLDRYRAWKDESPLNDSCQSAVEAFKQAVARAYPASNGNFHQVPFIRAFLCACKGHAGNLPVHYPRATQNGQPGPPSPDGESFKWFVANESEENRYALSDLAEDEGLPTLRPRGDKRSRG